MKHTTKQPTIVRRALIIIALSIFLFAAIISISVFVAQKINCVSITPVGQCVTRDQLESDAQRENTCREEKLRNNPGAIEAELQGCVIVR